MSDPMFSQGTIAPDETPPAEPNVAEGALPEVDLAFSKGDIPSGFETLDEGEYPVVIFESKLAPSKSSSGTNWVITPKVVDGYEPGGGRKFLPIYASITSEQARWKVVECYEAIFGTEWPAGGFSSVEDFVNNVVRPANGMTCRGIVLVEPHWDEAKAQAGETVNRVDTLLPMGSGGGFTGTPII